MLPTLNQEELQAIYQQLESNATNEVIRGLKKLRKARLGVQPMTYLLGMSWFHPDAMVRRRVKYVLFNAASEDFAAFLKGKWRFLSAPPLPKIWSLMEYLSSHPQIDADILRSWAYRTYHQTKELSLNNQQLHYVSSELGALKHIKTLNLNYNNLLTLPPELGQLKKLENLSLASNQLAVLPAQIKKLKKLKNLDLSANQGMNNLPSEIDRLQKLSSLHLAQNHFERIPLGVCKLEKLNELNFAQNQIALLPHEFAQLKKLQKLDLSYNKLNVLPLPVLSGLESLTNLDVSGNPIHNLPLGLKDLPKLKKIHLKNIPALASKQSQLGENFAPIQLIF